MGVFSRDKLVDAWRVPRRGSGTERCQRQLDAACRDEAIPSLRLVDADAGGVASHRKYARDLALPKDWKSRKTADLIAFAVKQARLSYLQEELNGFCRHKGISPPELRPIESEAVLPPSAEGCGFLGIPQHWIETPRLHSFMTEEIIADAVDQHALDHSDAINREKHPRLTEAWEQHCQAHGIYPVPELRSTASPLILAMVRHDERPDRQCMYLGPELMAPRTTVEEQLAVLSHELGHLLGKPETPRDGERFADRAAIELMGMPQPFAATIARFCEKRDRRLQAQLGSDNPETEKWAIFESARLLDDHDVHGPLKERLDEIEQYAPNGPDSLSEAIDARTKEHFSRKLVRERAQEAQREREQRRPDR